MAKFDIYKLSDGTLVMDCQSDYIRLFDTRVVIPLLPVEEDAAPVERLEPLLRVGEDDLILTTHLLAAVPRYELGIVVGSLGDHRDAVGAALDLLIYGF